MPVNTNNYNHLLSELEGKATLVAVSKTKPVEDIRELYDLGQRDFGENYVQELVDKQPQLPNDIRWHYIGHLQTNKVKYIAPFVHLIHGIDSLKLLKEVNKQADKNKRTIDCLLQVHIAEEETKHGSRGLEEFGALPELVQSVPHVRIVGLMGMATFTDDMEKVRKEFRNLKDIFDKETQFEILSMGMSSDYKVALEEGSNMVRIGSLLFGERS